MTHNGTIPCYPARDAVSNGALQGDNPTQFALPLLIIQITLVLVLTRTVAYLIRPFRQPRVLAEVIGGVLLGPSGLGRNKAYLDTVFPKQSLTLLDSTATLGLLFFMFMVGLELDVNEIRKSGKRALIIALSGISVPFVAGIGVSRLMHESLSTGAKFAPFAVLTGVPLSITAFPVLVRIMAERKLLSTELGKMALPAAAINDVCAWVLLAVGVALSGPSTSPAVPAYVLLSGVGFVFFMLFVVKRFMEWVARRATAEETVREIYVCVTMVGVLIAGFTTDLIGIHPLFGAFVFGMIIPKEGTFAQMLIEKIEDFVTVLMLPLFFASSGLKTNLGSISSVKGLGFLLMLILTAAFGKMSATVLAALWLKMELREAFAFAFLMNTKGLVELIVLNIGKDLGVFDEQTFAILVLMCLFLMFFTTPAVIALYKPARTPVPYTNRKLEGSQKEKEQLRILACIHGSASIPALLNLVEACRGPKKHTLKLYAMHLTELSDRTSTIMSLSRVSKRGTRTSAAGNQGNMFVAFEAYERLTKVPVRLLSTISELTDMHDDICKTAADKRATIIILPFHFYQREDGSIECTNQGYKAVNQRVLHHAPCSVGILVDKGLWSYNQLSETATLHEVAVLFFGGPDDREALAFGCKLVEHPNVKLWVIRFLPVADEQVQTVITFKGTQSEASHEIAKDEESLVSVRAFTGGESKGNNASSSIFYEEHRYDNYVEGAVAIAKSRDFSLFLVGRGHHPHVTAEKHSELGAVGEALIIIGGGDIKASVLVIQQHNPCNETHDNIINKQTQEH